MYRQADAPRYLAGHLTLLGLTGMSCALSLGMSRYLARENARRDAAYKAPAAYSPEEMAREADRGDDATFFRYTT